MKIKYTLLAVLILFSNHLYAEDSYSCLSDGGKIFLLVPLSYPNINYIKYYPYLKPIKISKIIKTEYGDQGGFKPEIYYTMNEIINGKITGRYTFMSQGYIIYNATYLNLKTKKKTEFGRVYGHDIQLKDVDCI